VIRSHPTQGLESVFLDLLAESDNEPKRLIQVGIVSSSHGPSAIIHGNTVAHRSTSRFIHPRKNFRNFGFSQARLR
jgi:hypothetical protein